MVYIQQSYRGLSLLMYLNWDRILYVATIVFALSLGGFMGTVLT